MFLCPTDWGVVVTKPVVRGDFLLEYRWVISQSDPENEESEYIYEFKHKGLHYWWGKLFFTPVIV